MEKDTSTASSPEARLTRQGLKYRPRRDGPPSTTCRIVCTGVCCIWQDDAKEVDGEVAVSGRVGEDIEDPEAARQMTLAALHAVGWLRDANEDFSAGSRRSCT